MDWTDEVIDRLRGYWAEGHSTAEIGRRMGISKNAVVGKAHRLGLSARPSPIRRTPARETARRPAIRRSIGPTLPPLSGPVDVHPVSHPPPSLPVREREPPAPVVEAVRAPPQSEPAPPAPRVAALAAPALRTVVRTAGGRVIPCCWPIGEPGTRSFRFCDAASAAGKPYCAEHAALAYVKIRERREDAA